MTKDPIDTAAGSGGAGSGNARDARCSCGSLLARWLDNGVELKCRRCKRMVIVDVRARRIEILSADKSESALKKRPKT
jgi:hypothetical protein